MTYVIPIELSKLEPEELELFQMELLKAYLNLRITGMALAAESAAKRRQVWDEASGDIRLDDGTQRKKMAHAQRMLEVESAVNAEMNRAGLEFLLKMCRHAGIPREFIDEQG